MCCQIFFHFFFSNMHSKKYTDAQEYLQTPSFYVILFKLTLHFYTQPYIHFSDRNSISHEAFRDQNLKIDREIKPFVKHKPRTQALSCETSQFHVSYHHAVSVYHLPAAKAFFPFKTMLLHDF